MKINIKGILNMGENESSTAPVTSVQYMELKESFALLFLTCVTDYVFQLKPLTIIKGK